MIRTLKKGLTYFDKSRRISNFNLNTNEMKTLKFEIQTLLAETFTGHPSREDEDDIRKVKEAVLLIAERIDIIHSN